MTQDLKKAKTDLSNCIWKTRKARIEMERRLILTKAFWSNILFLYSAINIVFSILYFNNNKYSSIILCISIFITMLGLYIRLSDIDRKIICIKECYTKLNLLYFEVNDIANVNALNEKQKEYTKLLNSYDNHSPSDFYRAEYNNSKTVRKPIHVWHNFIFYIWYYFLIYLITLAIPIILLVFFN